MVFVCAGEPVSQIIENSQRERWGSLVLPRQEFAGRGRDRNTETQSTEQAGGINSKFRMFSELDSL